MYTYITTITYELNDHFARNKNLLTITAMNRWTIRGDIYDQILTSTGENSFVMKLISMPLIVLLYSCLDVWETDQYLHFTLIVVHSLTIPPSCSLFVIITMFFVRVFDEEVAWPMRTQLFCLWYGGGVLHVCSQLFCLWSQFLYKSVKIVFMRLNCVHIYDRSKTRRTMHSLYMF